MHLQENRPIHRGTVTSTDGTVLSYQRLGHGAPLVVCHGSFATAQDWLPFAERMARTRTVFLYDRRGRGDSPAAPDFAIDAELDDLAAMIDLAGPEGALLGHSFGGGCALALAARIGFPGPLIVYEPRHSARGPVSRGHIPDIRRMLAAGDLDGATEFALAHVVGLPAPALAGLRSGPLWERFRQTIGAFPNELRLLDDLAWQPGDLDGIAGPCTLLTGGNSPVPPDASSPDMALRTLLPAIRARTIPDQGHFAYSAAPALLADSVDACLTGRTVPA
ncbi:alpha/beta fold hydrolase [Niveispirillum fermenti]|uniref:alpha/beta fold hydrolase n=1 Tax=Niveispirillum fermenti TaxID=1233113 RepID=UPI003A8C1709